MPDFAHGNISRKRLVIFGCGYIGGEVARQALGRGMQVTALTRNPETAAKIDALLKDWQHVPSRFQTQMARFHDALKGTGPLPVTSADSRRSLELVTAFYHSSATNEDVVLPIGPGHPLYESWVPAQFRAA